MNQHDRDNLQYIMSLSEHEFEVWASKITQDDLDYALEIMRARRLEIAEQEQDLEYKLEYSDFSEANAVLKKFML